MLDNLSVAALVTRPRSQQCCSACPLMARLRSWGHRKEAAVGDNSPKSKERGQKQKAAAKAASAAEAKSKQASQSPVKQTLGKGQK